MPDLHPTLHDEIVAFLLPRRAFRLADARLAELDPHLADWPDRHDLKWDAPANEFCHSFVKTAPGETLKRVLQETANQSGELDMAEAARLCRQIDAALAQRPAGTNPPHPLAVYYEALKAELSTGRYHVDGRFVQLTLLVDQGQETQGLRFVADSQRGKYDSLKKLLADVDDRALVLLGGPGSGKTTLLRRLQLETAWEGVTGGDPPDGDPRPVPFFVPLNAYRGARLADPPPDPAEWLAERWQKQQPDLPDFAALLRAGRMLLLLDGLNEMPHRDRADYGERVALWQLFVQDAPPGNTLLFSCRSLDYSVPLGSGLTPVRQVQVEPLTPGQIQQFLTLYLAEEGTAVWTALNQDPRQLTLFATPYFLWLLVDHKLQTGELLTSRTALLTGFVRRTLRREIEGQRPLFNAGPLLTTNDRQQVVHNRWAMPTSLPHQGALIAKLEALAFAMQDGRAADEAGQVRIPEETAHGLLNHPLAEDIVDAGIQLNVLDKDLTRLEITYLHQLLQEYFAARVLAGEPELGRVKTAWRADEIQPRLADWLKQAEVSTPLPPAPTTGWEETTVLAAAMTPNPAQFVTDLMPINLPLAARCAANPDVAAPPELVERLQTALLVRIGDPAADLRARIAAAEALGELGDPRFVRHQGPHGDYLLPPLVLIPGGTYTIGADDSQYDDEKPAHAVEVEPFKIGIFPVTNAEYRLFIEAGGYEDEYWWETGAARAWLRGESGCESVKQGARDFQKYIQSFSDDILRQQKVVQEQIDDWLWLKYVPTQELERQIEKWYPSGEVYHQPRFWGDSRFNHPSHPVVGVNWFETRAYCVWLSAQTGNSYRLPTEAEWEVAARGKERREYAFGSKYDEISCNTFETHVRRTTPVGIFTNGCTPEGINDLSGNVWEWVTTLWGEERNAPDYSYPYNLRDGRESQGDGVNRRICRGGSWVNVIYGARAAARGSLVPGSRNNDVGFRLVMMRYPVYL